MRVRLTVLSGRRRGERRLFDAGEILIGGHPSHTLCLPELPPTQPAARLTRIGHAFTIVALQSGLDLRVNGQAVDQGRLADGDLITIDRQVTLRFALVPEGNEPRKAFTDLARESARTAARLEAGGVRRGVFFVRDLCHCTRCDATRRVKVLCVASCVLVAVAAAWVGLMLARTTAAARRQVVALSAQVASGMVSRQRLEQQIDALRRVAQDKARTDAELDDMTRALEATRERLARLERERTAFRAAIERARGAVGFLVVGYALHERASGRPLRYTTVDADGTPQPDDRGAYQAAVDGTGPIVQAFATGSGFLIASDLVVTNRHVAEPWFGDSSIEGAVAHGFVPRVTTARAYFPGSTEPLAFELVRASEEADVALLRLPRAPRGLVALTLAPAETPVRTGDLVAVIGYPTGVDMLLAKMDDAQARQLTERFGDDLPALADELARRHLISPLVSLGHVGDTRPGTLVYDAATTTGSSGGPVLDAAGRVIAVNYAALPEFSGGRFGLPVRFVHRLIAPRASRRPRVDSGVASPVRPPRP